MKKLCILFSGIGYNCSRPLLYYSARLAEKKGYEVIRLDLDGFEKDAFGDDEKIRKCASHALSQSLERLENVKTGDYEKTVLIGKSIVTYAALGVNDTLGLNAQCILLTPLPVSLELPSTGAYAFHGTSDKWADTSLIKAKCSERHIKLFTFENANHSLETGDTLNDIKNLETIIETINSII